MKQICLQKPGQLEMRQVAEPGTPGLHDALVRVLRIGICGTDIHAFHGRQPFFSYPRVLGHEVAVEVLAVGSAVRNVRVGDTCAIEPYLTCGECIACRNGRTNCCRSLQCLGVHTDGTMQELYVIPSSNLIPSSTLSPDQLALVEPLGIGSHAVNRAQIRPGEHALVIGAGPIGLGTMQFAKAKGAQVTVVDISDHRLSFCRSKVGVEYTVNPTREDLSAAIEQITGGDYPTVIFDATGNKGSMEACFSQIAPGGRIVFVGLFQGDVTFNDPNFHRREITLMASRNATHGELAEVLAMIEAGSIDTGPWITHRTSFDNFIGDFESWLRPESGLVKGLIEVA